MPRCPQCRREQDVVYFQAPVKSCMSCYISLPWNDDLAQLLEEAVKAGRTDRARMVVQELKGRAASSKYARKKRLSELRNPWRGELSSSVASIPARTRLGSGESVMLDAGAVTCDGCNKQFEGELLELPGPGDIRPLVCPTCLERQAELEKHCSLCQARFPLVAMHTEGDGKFRCEECQDRYSKFTHTT